MTHSLINIDVLLVDHTSRFGRNQPSAFEYKEQLNRLGKVIVLYLRELSPAAIATFLLNA